MEIILTPIVHFINLKPESSYTNNYNILICLKSVNNPF